MAKNKLGEIVENIKPLSRVKRLINGKDYWVHYIDDGLLPSNGLYLLGYTYKRKIYVRSNLPKLVERGLLRHEVQHVNDERSWFGKYGKEIRANLDTLVHDPIGFTAVLLYSLNLGRLKTYWRLYIWPRNLN